MKRSYYVLLTVLLTLSALPSRGQTTLIRYTLHDTDFTLVNSGVVTNSGTLGNGKTNGTGGVQLTLVIPTNGVPPGAGNVALFLSGTSGVVSPGTQQLSNTAVMKAGGFTYECWFNSSGTGSVNAMIDYAGTQKLIRQASQSGPQMEYFNTNNAQVFNSIGTAAANQWHYAAVVFTATNLDAHTNVTGNFTFYLDTNVPTGFVSGAIISPYGDSLNRTIGVGTHPSAFASDFFNGEIYEPRVTLGALPAAGLLFNGLVVTNASDTGSGTLRAAITSAHAGTGITFSPALNGQTITLNQGPIDIFTNMTIDASSLTNGMTISTASGGRIFNVHTNVNLRLNSLTLTNGQVLSGSVPTNGGGAILNAGNLTLNNCTVQNNRATGTSLSGGGILSYNGSLTVSNCTFTGNAATLQGGAVAVTGGAGAFYNSTFYSNSSSQTAGAIYTGVTGISVNNCTVAGNTAVNGGGGIYNFISMNMTNTVVAGNSSSPPANISSFTGANNFTSGDPMLSPLGYYGGPTQTMPPRAGSPLIDGGANQVTNFLTLDQRGLPRLRGSQVDIGAVELNYALVSNLGDFGAGSLRAAVTNAPEVIGFDNILGGETIILTNSILIGTNVNLDASALFGGVSISGHTNFGIFEIRGGTVTMNALTIENGTCGISIDSGATLYVTNCTVTNNLGSSGIQVGGYLYVNNSTFCGNTGAYGGAISSTEYNGFISVANSTFFNNVGGDGGAFYCEGLFQTNIFNNCTFASNSSFDGGGLYIWADVYLNMTNTIVAGNSSPTFTDFDNKTGFFNSVSNLIGGSPRLAAPGYYGGSTMTMPPLSGSPALNAGFDAVTNFLTADQRGFPRLSGTHVDIGATEGQMIPPGNAPSLSNLSWANGSGGVGSSNSFQLSFANLQSSDFSVVASTNVALPVASWTTVGKAIEVSPGQYQFIDGSLTNGAQRFYRVVSP